MRAKKESNLHDANSLWHKYAWRKCNVTLRRAKFERGCQDYKQHTDARQESVLHWRHRDRVATSKPERSIATQVSAAICWPVAIVRSRVIIGCHLSVLNATCDPSDSDSIPGYNGYNCEIAKTIFRTHKIMDCFEFRRHSTIVAISYDFMCGKRIPLKSRGKYSNTPEKELYTERKNV